MQNGIVRKAEELEALYGTPGETSLVKELDRIIPELVSIDGDLCASFAVGGKPARSVVVISVDAVYFQCARAIHRSELWNPARHVDPKSLPTPGAILEATSGARIDGRIYDARWPERARKTMW